MWQYRNPVEILFGAGSFERLPGLLQGQSYAIVTYDEPFFNELATKLEAAAGPAQLVVRDIMPNPDYRHLSQQTARFCDASLDVIVALGGGSVIDSAKVFAAGSGGDFSRVSRFLETKQGEAELAATPIIAVPTTAGTGSEVTCWATVWKADTAEKYSLARANLYPRYALIDPLLMLSKPRQLTISTGLDALSHALESLWNVNANPVSAAFAVTAAREIVDVLPKLASDLRDIGLRTRMARAALFAGLAFSNTKTAIAHSLSYPITLRHNIQHGIACSFSLPLVMRSVAGADGICREGLHAIFGSDIRAGSLKLEAFLEKLGVSTDPNSYGVAPAEWTALVEDAIAGERGRNFIGSKEALMRAIA